MYYNIRKKQKPEPKADNNKKSRAKRKQEEKLMLNYSIRLRTIKDAVELKKIMEKFDINGTISQNGFHGNPKSLLSNIAHLPLDNATITIDGYRESQLPYLDQAFSSLAA